MESLPGQTWRQQCLIVKKKKCLFRRNVMLCRVMLWYVTLCYVLLCYFVLLHVVLCYVMLCDSILLCVMRVVL